MLCSTNGVNQSEVFDLAFGAYQTLALSYGLNMSADVVGGTDGPQEYRLFGVSNHFGSLTGGHYTAACFNPSTKQFYNFDDHEITAVPQRQVKSSAAYLLFYTSMELSVPKVL
ncbi:Ubiquitin carboxyl-terminal hydrolase 8 [Geodia barretti]|uniref:ubiquitinyl hydrolase 1 n=1 Tax=Geodia barretti TaxID=519541 RepID=A0AA35QT93_GEOBA|nr:Ubiquitin carboxyl-terminal hydrolase 8 [Geodia barretti]